MNWRRVGWRREHSRTRPHRRRTSLRESTGAHEVHVYRAWDDVVWVFALDGKHLAVVVSRDASHIIVHRREHRNRLPRHIDA